MQGFITKMIVLRCNRKTWIDYKHVPLSFLRTIVFSSVVFEGPLNIGRSFKHDHLHYHLLSNKSHIHIFYIFILHVYICYTDCSSFWQVAFKLNTVVNTFNKLEDMAAQVTALNPCRWKVCIQPMSLFHVSCLN